MEALDIGLAMVAARIASSETEKDREIRKQRENRLLPGGQAGRRKTGTPPLSRVKLEVVRDRLILVPSAEPSGMARPEEPTPKRGAGRT